MIQPIENGPASALSQLTHSRWALPALAYVAQHGGCKFVTMSRQLGAPPGSLRRALERLGTLGLVVRNPGYGHPMRPEYILGPVGERSAGLPAALLQWAARDGVADEVLKKWQLPVLVSVGPERARFHEIQHGLPVTARALSLALKSHHTLGLLEREVEASFPPVPRYSLTAQGLAGRAPALRLGEILAEARLAG